MPPDSSHDPVDWIQHLHGPPPPAEAPAWPSRQGRRRRVVGGGVALALAALALLWVFPKLGEHDSPAVIGLRGGDADSPTVDLRLALVEGDQTRRVLRGGTYGVGDTVVFRLASSRPAMVYLWVDTPAGPQQIATVDSRAELVDVGAEGRLTAYRFPEPGAYRFVASISPSPTCEDRGCRTFEVEVE